MKKVLAVILAALMILSFVACDEETQSTITEGTSPTLTDDTTTVPTPTTPGDDPTTDISPTTPGDSTTTEPTLTTPTGDPTTEPDPTTPSGDPTTEPDPTAPSTVPTTEPDPTAPSTEPTVEPTPTTPSVDPTTDPAPTTPSDEPTTEPTPTMPSDEPTTEPDPTIPSTEPEPTAPSTIPSTEPEPTAPSTEPSTKPGDTKPGTKPDPIIPGITKPKITFKTLTVNGTNVTGVVGNEVTTFSFLDEIKTKGSAKYTVSFDISGTDVIPTKTVALNPGDNVFYVFATLGNESKLYTVTIRRRPMYTVSFVTQSGVSLTESQTVEEGECATVPSDPSINGYTFIGWDFDFNNPILDDTYIVGNVEANAYKITYDANGGSVTNITQDVVYDSSYTLETPTREGYIFEGWYDGETLYSDGTWTTLNDVTLKAQWTVITYYRVTVSGTVGTTVSGGGEYASDSIVTVTSKYRLGYIFVGWYDGNNNLVSTNPTYTFTMGASDIELYANWKMSDEMSVFDFTSSETTCTILGVCDDSKTAYYIPEYVTTIGNGAFEYCSYLATITIPNSVTYIGERAFYSCRRLANVVIPNSVTYIGDYAFYNCDNLTSVTIPGSVRTMGDYVFSMCDGLTSATICDGVSSIERGAFSGCDNLTSVSIGNGLTKIGHSSFSNCKSLTSVNISNSVTAIDGHAFYGCRSLTSISIPKSVKSIGNWAFNSCASLTRITYQGTTSEWFDIDFDGAWRDYTPDMEIVCTNGTITYEKY